MLNDNLINNTCNNQSHIEDKVDRLEKVIEGYDERFNTRNLFTQNLEADKANIDVLTAGGINSLNINGGAVNADSLVVDGAIKADSFEVAKPVMVNKLTTPEATIENLNASTAVIDDANIKNLTVDNLMTGPESSLEYKNLSVTENTTLNHLNLKDPYVTELSSSKNVVTDLYLTSNLTVAGKNFFASRADNSQKVLSFGDGVTYLGDKNNAINILSDERPKWKDNGLATLQDVQQGTVKPVYKGIVETYDELPNIGNNKGDLYIVKQLVISDQVGIGHTQWNGFSWDASLIYELNLFTNTLYDQEVGGNKTFLEHITGSIDVADQQTFESLPASADFDTLIDDKYIGKLLYGNATGSTNGPVDLVGDFTLISKVICASNTDKTILQTISFIEEKKVIVESRVIKSDKTVLAEWTRLTTDELFWKEINAIKDGTTPIKVLTNDAENQAGSKVAFRSDTYTKDEVDNLLSSVYEFKGSVATYANLPTTDRSKGDVWNVEDTGLNWAWTGTEWDELGMNIDLNLYAKKTDVPGIKVNNAKQADDSTKISGLTLSQLDARYVEPSELGDQLRIDYDSSTGDLLITLL